MMALGSARKQFAALFHFEVQAPDSSEAFSWFLRLKPIYYGSTYESGVSARVKNVQ